MDKRDKKIVKAFYEIFFKEDVLEEIESSEYRSELVLRELRKETEVRGLQQIENRLNFKEVFKRLEALERSLEKKNE